MKTKLILLACVSIATAGCKKNNMDLIQPQTPGISTEKQIADLIQKADKNLYDEVYNQRSGTVDVRIIHGVFVAQSGDIASGTCLPHPTNPCMVIITSGSAVGGNSVVNGNTNLQFPETNPAQLIVNTPQPVVQNITELSTTNSFNGSVNVIYK